MSVRSVDVIRKVPTGVPAPSDGLAGIGIAFAADMEGNFTIHSLHPEGSAFECGQVGWCCARLELYVFLCRESVSVYFCALLCMLCACTHSAFSGPWLESAPGASPARAMWTCAV